MGYRCHKPLLFRSEIQVQARFRAGHRIAEEPISAFWNCFSKRKAWLFADSAGGAKASTNLYSLVQTCVANRVDAYRHLVDLFTALPYAKTVGDYDALLPWNLAKRERDASA